MLAFGFLRRATVSFLILSLLLVFSITMLYPSSQAAGKVLELRVQNYNVSFFEKGLPTGSSWNVTFDGSTRNSTDNTILFYDVPEGFYEWSAPPVALGQDERYSPSEGSGWLNVSKDSSVNVTYTSQYYLNIEGSSGGTFYPPSGWFNASSSVAISAKPLADYMFENWAGSGNVSYSGENENASITMNGPISEFAEFSPLTDYTITFLESGLPQGTYWSVNLNGISEFSNTTSIVFSGLQRGVNYSWSTQGTLPNGPAIQYLANKAYGEIALRDTNSSETISYTTQYYVTIEGSNGGSVNPASGWYDSGVTLPISASPNSGYYFEGWQIASTFGIGSDSIYSPSISITVNGAGTIMAIFGDASSTSVTHSTSNGGLFGLNLPPLPPQLSNPVVLIPSLIISSGLVMILIYFLIKRLLAPK